MVTGLSGNDLLLYLRETGLEVVLHKSLGLFLVLFAFGHYHLQYLLLVVHQRKPSKLHSHSLASLNVRTHDVVTVRYVGK